MIIAVFGNSGSGKSTLAAKLALEFAARKKNTILIDADYNAPQLNVWFPKLDAPQNSSLSVLLDNNVDVEAVIGKTHKISTYLGVIGYTKNFASNSMPSRPDTSEAFLRCLSLICDVAIVDCQSAITQDVLSLVALDIADVRLVEFTPDIKALSWYDSNVKMVQEQWTNNNKAVVKVLNKTLPSTPGAAIESETGTIDFYLPYSSDIEEDLYLGTIGTDRYKKHARKYVKILESLVDKLETYDNRREE